MFDLLIRGGSVIDGSGSPARTADVAITGDRIVAVGKVLADFDAYDTGVFAVGPKLFAALAAMPDPSLTDGVSALAERGEAGAIDCSGLDWLDVDEKGYLVVHDETGSKIDGVFIAGDVHDHRYRQAVTAAADGCKAAIDAERWLEAEGITEAATTTAW